MASTVAQFAMSWITPREDNTPLGKRKRDVEQKHRRAKYTHERESLNAEHRLRLAELEHQLTIQRAQHKSQLAEAKHDFEMLELQALAHNRNKSGSQVDSLSDMEQGNFNKKKLKKNTITGGKEVVRSTHSATWIKEIWNKIENTITIVGGCCKMSEIDR